MAVLPIDLQTLFMRLHQVGREQAVEKEAAHVAQSLQGSQMARRAEEQARTVNQTRELERGPEGVREDERKNQSQEHPESEQRERREAGRKKNVYQDPALGTRIDITG